jgi:hypothetical protein
MTSILSLEDISVLDKQIDQLMDYKPIPEHEVKALCDKVCFKPFFIFTINPQFFSHNQYSIQLLNRQKRFYQKRAMYNQ